MIPRATLLVAPVIVAAGVLIAPATVFADPAGPTDFRSEVVAVEPPTPAIEVDIAGGDSFVVLTVAPGTEVVVLGYEGEPYLRIDAAGDVYENRRSPATYYNRERYGADVPAFADATAAPEWTRIGGGGATAWHDHRAHRMETFAPVNVGRGEPVLDSVVPLVVDGRAVEVHVTSTWMPSPSPWPWILAGVAGVATAGAAIRSARRHAVGAALLVAAAAAVVVGLAQYRSLPATTGPRLLWWLAPLVAVAAGAAAVGLRARHAALAASAVAAAQLVVWSLERRDGLVRAVLPTQAPFWFDRAVTAFAAAVGAITLVWAVVALVTTPATAPARSPR